MLFHAMRARRNLIVTYTLYINLILTLILPSISGNRVNPSSQSNEISNDENDFAEFEDFDEEDNANGFGNLGGDINLKQPRKTSDSSRPILKPSADGLPSASKNNARQERGVIDHEEEEDDEDDIFESMAQSNSKQGDGESQPGDGLKITRVPTHFRRNWDSYHVEILFVFGIILYFINFFSGSSKNSSIANTWLDVNLDLLESNFSLVGDDGKPEIENHGLLKDTESVFLLWCSGRSSVEGMLIETRLWKRQDLMSVITKLFKPVNDQVIFKLTLSQDAMDSYVFCLANKKSATRLIKESADLAVFCPERKNVEKFGINASKFVLMNEIGEVSSFFFDNRIVSLINKFEDVIDYIHISDQYSGPRASDLDPQPLKLPEVKKILHVAFNLSTPKCATSLESIESQRSLVQMIFYIVDKVKKYRLSKEGKNKSEKDRQKVEETFLKATHAQRQEAAQLKREEKRRAERERILAEQDPDKQRKWEEREHRKEMKRKVPKMKQMKVKAM